MRHWTVSSSVQGMAWHLIGAKPLHKPVQTDWQSDPQEQTSGHFNRNSSIFIDENMLNMSSKKWQPFCLGLDHRVCKSCWCNGKNDTVCAHSLVIDIQRLFYSMWPQPFSFNIFFLFLTQTASTPGSSYHTIREVNEQGQLARPRLPLMSAFCHPTQRRTQ